ncbi:WecB/TagA/CpsF family glycosyltransferase [Arthrobacter sp. ISL-65]|uniref:WecB/TagA/CpsF family glycosyltransferase n=1 Tax=Arthrobacter sp. ISL-65 TaxID=2819112 RepID=UPI001BE9E325|nr:WecB/TagA/CpsF family glycosyltransferase [Arthrobacter sp. ISL-65]MBT2549619.1 WecB/TagA/CpsF family glycosyltransferase [Arthrobacter sp. ISL-65]
MTIIESAMRCGKLRFRAAGLESAIDHVIESVLRKGAEGSHIHFANAYSVSLAERSAELESAFSEGTIFPDGRPVVWALRAFNPEKADDIQQVRGPSFFEGLMNRGVNLGLRHYFLGSTDETLSKLQAQLKQRIPGVSIAGVSSPPFRELTDGEWAKELQKIESQNADIVWVGLGTPKQDLVARRLSGMSSLTFICVGAAFDFSAGNLRHAPRWIQGAGLEWFYRLIQEPRRLWRRYLIGNTVFLVAVSRQSIEGITSRLKRRVSN